ncbi:IS3 family transposase [Listeria monocytogenes]|nr:IS3 family transposase [Listeria monocytogenes]
MKAQGILVNQKKSSTNYGVIYTSFEQLNQAINEWTHYYNHHRIKTKLGCSPIQYRERMTA